MAVPEASVDENDCLIFGQYYIRITRQLFDLNTEPQTTREKILPHNHLRLRILPLNSRHTAATLLRCSVVITSAISIQNYIIISRFQSNIVKNTTKTPRQEWISCRGVGWDYFLVKAEAGDVGLFDDVGIVTLGLVEGKGEVLDAVFGAELHKEVGELSQFGGEPFYIVCRGDSTKQ